MTIINARDIVAFPGGANASDTLIGNVHFNLTTLDLWNYTLFSNGTLSNGSWCILTFPPYAPSLVLDNGTFVNVTWCYHPVNPIGVRAGIGIGFAVMFAIALGLTLMALHKHGRLYLPAEKRFWPIGRRWQWYWAIFASATALISLFTTVDVDRYYLPELPIVLTCFFWYLMQMGVTAIVWEAVRHWGSWMERQYIDPNPFVLPQDDARSKFEFYVPLAFYFFLWMNFFIIIPRNWGNIELQRYPEQIINDAIPTATDGRFKAGAFLLLACWLITVFFLRHSIKHYRERNRGIINRVIGLFRFTPFRFILLIPLGLTVIAYQALAAWEFAWSPLNVKGNNVAIYAGGYAPTLLILFIQIVWGFVAPNEDLELQCQRRVRGADIDRELGLSNKPAWWRRARADFVPHEHMRDRIARNVREIGGGKATARNLEERREAAAATPTGLPTVDDVELESMSKRPLSLSKQATDLLGPIAPGDFSGARTVAERYGGKSDRRRTERTVGVVAGMLFPDADPAAAAAATANRRAELMTDGPPPGFAPPPYVERGRMATTPPGSRPTTMGRGISADTTDSTSGPPQQIRSMLDI
ncbi:hypothetical protein B0T25DRAFT_551794 [Lasiosphaeria hispida]|uniref:Uncharacterized protein n=1 Tax=Lasiosphaeria hispida TaxID=260671 RepID=A0AAJ0HB34_9PEZI|nr:hypothetical protein B0T25DRAFT_551794 [Lasiosphaeria hispida]